MLRRLGVKNFAVVGELSLELGPGLSVFTGETGAGKSILVEALGFLAGGRGSTDWLRQGAARLEVEGVFDAGDLPPDLRRQYACGPGPVVVRRELDAGGRSSARIAGRPATVAALSAFSAGFVDFHGQHEHQTLLSPAAQLELLDGFGALEERRAGAASAYGRWRSLKAELEAADMSEDERSRRVELIGYQVGEIEDADPRPGEEGELEAELPRLKNSAKLSELSASAYDLLYREEGSACEALGKAGRLAAELARLDPGLEPLSAALAAAEESVAETATKLSDYREGLEAGPERLDALLGRQDRLAKLRRKYGATLVEVLAARDRLKEELARLEGHAERAGGLEAEAAAAEGELAGLCGELHQARVRAGRRLAERAAAELADLGLGAARLGVSVELEEGAYGPTGADRAEFLFAPNPGEPLKSLRAVASGGELSRVMLALKTVLARQDRVGLLVFDEVDAGVGGLVGRSVGLKLLELARSRQVLCVTHLPQIACLAAAQFWVSKAVAGGRTAARVERLEGEARLEAVARMLGGRKATEASRRHARELLESK